MNQGPRWTLLMKKTRAEKSRATVPLSIQQVMVLKGFKNQDKYFKIVYSWRLMF
jgi:hypothetical protein